MIGAKKKQVKSSEGDARSVSLPAEAGFRIPAEWEAHEATWIAWPHNHADWPGKFPAISWVYAEIVRHLHLSEPVRILVNDKHAEERASRILKRAGVDLTMIDFVRHETDRVWTRDYGPIFVTNQEREIAITDWKFNAWAKYPNWRHDDQVPRKIAKGMRRQSWQPKIRGLRVVLEGGSIDVNGKGTLLTTEECLLSSVQARNPELTRGDLEQAFADYLGIGKVLWLNRGIVGDDTHGHIDDLARFVGPRTIVCALEEDPADANYEPLKENFERLRAMTDQDGQTLELITLPMPGPLIFAEQRLPASYANFYIANERVLVPTFDDPNDRKALQILADLFPERIVVGIHAVDLVWGLGTLHCLTQQEPKRRKEDESKLDF